MTDLPHAPRLARLEAAAACARQRPVPWDEARAERVARRATQRARSPLAVGLRGFAGAAIASLALLAFYIPAARAIRDGSSDDSTISSQPRSESTASDSFDTDPSRPLGDGGLEAGAE
jgi:hypothetical protein